MGAVDGHCHLADKRFEQTIDSLIQDAFALGISDFIQGGVGPEDWDRQMALKLKYGSVHCCFGLHPYWVIDHSEQEIEDAYIILKEKVNHAVAIGELGLDFRPRIVGNSQIRQVIFFKRQLELAQKINKPMVFHIVNAHKEALEVFNLYKTKNLNGMIHSFNGSRPQVEDFLKLDLHISVGGPVCRLDNRRLHQAVSVIPMNRLCLETDSPDQPPPNLKTNTPASIIQVAEAIAKIKKITSKEVLDNSNRNLRKLFAI